jgi:hypothetical protein
MKLCRKVIRFVDRLISWLPILWKHEDWDYSTLLYQIKHQVGRFAKVQRFGHAAHWSERILECDRFRHLVELVQDDPDDEWNDHYIEFHKYKDDINAPCPASNKVCKRILNLSSKRTESNWHNMWKYLDKYCRNWWD